MSETIMHFFEDESEAAEKFSYYRTTGLPVLMIGPTTLLTPAGTKIDAIVDGKKYYIVLATNAGAVASPAILPPP